jgi:hypothetical protein
MPFPDETVARAWKRCGIICECAKKIQRGDRDSPHGWEAQHKWAI